MNGLPSGKLPRFSVPGKKNFQYEDIRYGAALEIFWGQLEICVMECFDDCRVCAVTRKQPEKIKGF